MRLSERLEQVGRSRSIIRSPRPLQQLKMDATFERLVTKYDAIGAVTGVDYGTIAAKLRSAAQVDTAPVLSPRELRLAAHCLFDPAHLIADDDATLKYYLSVVRRTESRSAFKALIYAYCVHFDPSRLAIQQIAAVIREGLLRNDRHRDWSERHRLYRFFDPSAAPHELATRALEAPNPRTVLRDLGLARQLTNEGLSAHVFLSAIRIIQSRLSNVPKIRDINRAIAWMQLDNGELLFSRYRGQFADALLLSFVDKEPDEEIRTRIQNFLLDAIGDPRLDHGQWLGADETARGVLVRWLTQATLEQFLRVVDRVAPRHQWDDRRAFWGAYVDKGMVANAWVAFASGGASVARQISEATSDRLMRQFALLRDPSSSDQAVLLLTIGDLIIADWSHNGKLRIWKSSNRSAPAFNLANYPATALRQGSDFETSHLPPGGWQPRVEAFIRRQTGIRLLQIEYMNRGPRE